MQEPRLPQGPPDTIHFGIVPEQRTCQRSSLSGLERRGRLPRGLAHDHEVSSLEAHVERSLRLGRRTLSGLVGQLYGHHLSGFGYAAL